MAGMKIKEGDWVSFYQNGKLTISEIRYIIRKQYDIGFDYYTDRGVISKDSILEVRTKNESTRCD
jgi:hypothetical protein